MGEIEERAKKQKVKEMQGSWVVFPGFNKSDFCKRASGGREQVVFVFWSCFYLVYFPNQGGWDGLPMANSGVFFFF